MIVVEIAEALQAYEAYGKRAAVIFLGEARMRALEAEMARQGEIPDDSGDLMFTVDDRPVRSGDFPEDYIGFRSD